MNPRLVSLTLASLLIMTGLSAQTPPAAPAPLVLWYDRPAQKWVEALPLGNGRLGAMVFGGVEHEKLALNEDTLVSGEPPGDLRSINLTGDLDQVAGLIRAGKNVEADAYVAKHWLGRNQQCYQPLGDLLLDVIGSGDVTDYRRWLDLATATTGVSY